MHTIRPFAAACSWPLPISRATALPRSLTGPDAGGGPHVRVFIETRTTYGGSGPGSSRIVDSWSGVRVAAGDIDGDGPPRLSRRRRRRGVDSQSTLVFVLLSNGAVFDWYGEPAYPGFYGGSSSPRCPADRATRRAAGDDRLLCTASSTLRSLAGGDCPTTPRLARRRPLDSGGGPRQLSSRGGLRIELAAAER